jgi:protein-tyrosine phosphatase
MVRVLFVCLGNICRSPTAQGVFAKMVGDEGLGEAVVVDSAGTHAYHIGERPDPRAQKAALKRAIDLSALRARRVVPEDFEEFDYVVAMDRGNFEHLQSMCPPAAQHKLHLFLNFAPELNLDEVPDPYYGGPAGFERVIDLIEDASRGLIAHIRERHR